jgi:hypothetical protein
MGSYMVGTVSVRFFEKILGGNCRGGDRCEVSGFMPKSGMMGKLTHTNVHFRNGSCGEEVLAGSACGGDGEPRNSTRG